MTDADIVVVSTGLRSPTRSWCIDSVQRQKGARYLHLCVDAERQDPPRTKIENLRSSIERLPPDTIVCVVDLDDWLEHENVLARVVAAHRAGAWLTYGSFRYGDGRAGFARPVIDARHGPWCATHLKSFRAGLFQAVHDEDLRGPVGPWIDRADDLAYMIPMLEMAAARALFISEVLYVYNYAHSWERSATPHELAHELACAQWVRSLAPYARLEVLP